MARQKIRNELERLSRTEPNPLYPDRLLDKPPSTEGRHSRPPRSEAFSRNKHSENRRGLGLNWKDAVIFSLLVIFGGIYQVRAASGAVTQASDFLDTISTGVLFDNNPQGVGRLELVSSRISTDAVGIVASSQMTQVFQNNSGHAVEDAVYAFGLPDQAAVYRMRLRIGQRVIESEIHEIEQARAIYDRARRAGKKAGLLQQHRPNLFTTRVSHILPGQSVQVEIFWQQPVRYDKGVFELRLPLAFKPRYEPAPAAGNSIQPAVTDSVSHSAAESIMDRHQRRIDVRLEAGFPLARLESLYHHVTTETDSDITRIHFADSQLSDANDFVLRWQPARGKSVQLATFHERYQGADHQLLLVLPPAMPKEKKSSLAREVIFVIDTSGSMFGTAMEQAKDALLYGLQQLQGGDHFNVIEFNNTANALFATSQPITSETLALAMNFVDGLKADGGTNMQPALQLALKPSPDQGRLKQVIFITDGAVGNEAELFREIHTHLGDARLFTIGIGGAPNSHFMRKAAEHGRGSYTYVARLDEVDQRLSELFDKISTLALTGLELDINPDAIWQNPAVIPDLYRGEPVAITLRGKTLPDRLTLFGETVSTGSGVHLWQKDLRLRPHESPGIARLWARQRLEDWQDQRELGLADAEELKEKMTRLALDYHLLSPFTALVAVDKTPTASQASEAKKTGAKRLGRINNTLAAAPFPQTALGWKWQLFSGALLLVLAAGLGRHLTRLEG